MRVFIAGGTGAIGQRLIPLLIEGGHDVVATTRRADRCQQLRALGAEPIVMDGLDAGSVGEAVARAEPDVVVHQMTALTDIRSYRKFDAEFAVTNELRTRGTDHLLTAAEAVGVRRFVAQSYTGWPNVRSAGCQDRGRPARSRSARQSASVDGRHPLSRAGRRRAIAKGSRFATAASMAPGRRLRSRLPT